MPEETPKPPATRTRAAKPRAGIQRKTREEREQFARQEAERQQARNAEASKNASARGGTRGARGGRGGRGGAAGLGMGDTRARDGPGSGGGVFGAGGGLRSSMRSRALPEGYSEMLDGGQSSKSADAAMMKTLEGEDVKQSFEGAGGASGSRLTASTTRYLDNVDIATDDEADDHKRDIERIFISSGEDEDEDEDEDAIIIGSRKQKAVRRTPRGGSGLRPLRALREPREEEEHTSAARKKSNRALKKSDAEIHDTEADDDNAMDVDEQPSAIVKEQPPSSPEMRRRSLRKSSTKSKETRIATETIEERAERLRLTEDTYKLRDIFVGRQPRQHSAIADEDDEEEDNEEADAEEATLENGKLFLFQLPPLTPFLYDPSTDTPADPEVKQEPGMGDNISAVPPTTTSQRKQSDTAPSKPGIKSEATASGDANTASGTGPSTKQRPPLQLDGLLTASEPTRLPAGLVGKLRVHKSGKVSLDWGGTDMEVRYGTEVDFLQDAVLIETKKQEREQKKNDGTTAAAGTGGDATATGESSDGGAVKKDDAEGDLDLRSGKTYALGQVRRKMVLIPDWAKLYD